VAPARPGEQWKANKDTFNLWYLLGSSSPYDPEKRFAIRTRPAEMTRGLRNQEISQEEWLSTPDAHVALGPDAQTEQNEGTANAAPTAKLKGEEWHRDPKTGTMYLTQRGCLVEAVWVLHESNEASKAWLELARSLYQKEGRADTDTEVSFKAGAIKDGSMDTGYPWYEKVNARFTAHECLIRYLMNSYLRVAADPITSDLKVYSGREFDKPVVQRGILDPKYRPDLGTFARVWKQVEMNAKDMSPGPAVEVAIQGQTFTTVQDYEAATNLVWTTTLKKVGPVTGIFSDVPLGVKDTELAEEGANCES